MIASAGLHGRPATGLSNARADRRRAVRGSENSDLTSDYGISFRQAQRDHPRLL